MDHPTIVELAAKLGAGGVGRRQAGEVPAERYTSAEWFARERAAIFARRAQPVAAEAELDRPGACLTTELAGVPIVVTKANDGALHAFRNACRHRSTELVARGPICRKTALVCRYHGWTYDLTGALVHVPHEEAFDGHCDSRRSLSRVFVEARHGLVWASLQPFSGAAALGPIDDELSAFELSRAAFFRRSEREVHGNWKLVIDAFLDGYHLKHLHQGSIYSFFLDGAVESQRAGPHVRSVVGRRALREQGAPVRAQVTPTYLVFPSSIAVLHPDFMSVLTCFPLSVDRTRFVHLMWVESPSDAAHWEKSHALIDGKVFGEEDLGAVEAVQRGLQCGANEALLFGELEEPALWFHETVASQIDEHVSARRSS